MRTDQQLWRCECGAEVRQISRGVKVHLGLCHIKWREGDTIEAKLDREIFEPSPDRCIP